MEEALSEEQIAKFFDEGYEILGIRDKGNGYYSYLLENPKGKQEHYMLFIPLKSLKVSKRVCGELNCDKVYEFERRKDSEKFAIHEFEPHGAEASFIIIPKKEFKPEKKQSFETLEEAKKAIEGY